MVVIGVGIIRWLHCTTHRQMDCLPLRSVDLSSNPCILRTGASQGLEISPGDFWTLTSSLTSLSSSLVMIRSACFNSVITGTRVERRDRENTSILLYLLQICHSNFLHKTYSVHCILIVTDFLSLQFMPLDSKIFVISNRKQCNSLFATKWACGICRSQVYFLSSVLSPFSTFNINSFLQKGRIFSDQKGYYQHRPIMNGFSSLNLWS